MLGEGSFVSRNFEVIPLDKFSGRHQRQWKDLKSKGNKVLSKYVGGAWGMVDDNKEKWQRMEQWSEPQENEEERMKVFRKHQYG
jgi:hypothetical protein